MGVPLYVTSVRVEPEWECGRIERSNREQRRGLDLNFLSFVETAIQEKLGQAEQSARTGSIDFDDLLPISNNTRIVAAQGLLHVLSLGTKSMIRVQQDSAFGSITLRLL